MYTLEDKMKSKALFQSAKAVDDAVNELQWTIQSEFQQEKEFDSKKIQKKSAKQVESIQQKHSVLG